MVAERLWEYVVGWCLIGCIFVGAALIVGANFTVHGDPASATPWRFKTEEGDSLMDNIVAHIMRAALGMQDFEDQLMEHGIFVFIVGINGFVLVRQRVFERRRHHEQELLRGGMLPIEMGKEVAGGYDLEEQVEEKMGDDGSPDFATMSFLAWFNYLQVGILIIEFLQLFSFPLRELMEFYNQAAKTSAMYEGAKTILNVFRTTATDSTIGNDQLDKKATERPTFALEIPEKDKEVTAAAAAAVLDQHADDMEWLLKHAPSHAVNATEAVTSTTTHQSGAQKLGASVDWIKENLPSWLPNITALMDNNTVDGSRFEELRDNLVNAAVGVALQGFGEAINSTAGSNVTTLSGVNGDSSGKVKSPTGKMSGGSGSNSGDGDIVMQVVNSLGPQSSINTHDCSVMMTLLDPASTVAPSASSLLCTGPLVQPALYLTASLFAYTLAYVLFMVFLTSFERVPAKGEICFRPNGVAVLKNLGLLLAVDFLLIQSPAQRRFRGLVSIGIMLAMACYTIRMKPCYWNKVNYWRTFSFSYVLYGSLLVALLCPSPAAVEKAGKAAEREHRVGEGRWVMAPHLKMGPAWMVGGGPKVMLAWIAAGWDVVTCMEVPTFGVFEVKALEEK
ncbi:hypothetical protein BGX29_001616 [Mortierella sp. GBA35]|nr:hypothetical protein BGX29_001616 [Mortierella sp. GBA35]